MGARSGSYEDHMRITQPGVAGTKGHVVFSRHSHELAAISPAHAGQPTLRTQSGHKTRSFPLIGAGQLVGAGYGTRPTTRIPRG